jgi:hypothetical protein
MVDVDVDMQVVPPARFTVRGLLVFTAGIGAVMAFAVALGSPEIPAVASVLFIAWLAWRFKVASRVPLIMALIGALILIVAFLLFRFNGSFGAAIAVLQISFIGTVTMAAAAFCFPICALLHRQRRLVIGNLTAMLLTLATWGLWLFGGMGWIGAMRNAEAERRAVEDPQTLQRLVDDANQIVQKLGRAPQDQQEFEALLGRPMPTVYDGGDEWPVSYHRIGENTFQLHHEMWATDDHIYQSTNPAAGFVQHFY